MDQAAHPAQAGALEGILHAPVEDLHGALGGLYPLSCQLDAEDGGGEFVGVGGGPSGSPNALSHPAHEATVTVLVAQPPGELVQGQAGDFERAQTQAQGGLEVAPAEVCHLLQQGRPDQLQQGTLLLLCGAPLDRTLVAGFGQQPELGPDAGLQLDLGEAQIGDQVGDEGSVARVRLVAREVVELPGAGDHEGLHNGVGQADSDGALGQDLPVLRAGFHAQHQARQLVALLQVTGPAGQRSHAGGGGGDAKPAQADLVACPDEHHHGLLLGQVDPGDERVRGDQPGPALQLGRPATHATGYLHLQPLRFGVVDLRILEGLLDDRNTGRCPRRAVEMTRRCRVAWTTLRVAHIPTARRRRRAIPMVRT